jgi:hypothetical protein
LPLREWSRIDDKLPADWDFFFKALGLAIEVTWVAWFMARSALLRGWEVKMGGIARRIRRSVCGLMVEGSFVLWFAPNFQAKQ